VTSVLHADVLPAGAAVGKVRPALRTVLSRLVVAGAIVVLDLWSKSAVFDWIQRLDAAGELVPGRVRQRAPPLSDRGRLVHVHAVAEPGAAFGQLHSIPYLLVGGRAIAVLFLVWLLVRTPRGRPWFTAALVLVLGGALGNLYDNLARTRDLVQDRYYPLERFPYGPVRDFIDVYFGVWRWHFPTFNVADACITVGAVLLLASGFFGKRRAGGGVAARVPGA
jgi:signal peptidase II